MNQQQQARPLPLLVPPPHCRDSTIPYWAVIVASLAALLATVLVSELWVARGLHASLTNALAAALHFAVDGISAFLVTGLTTQVS